MNANPYWIAFGDVHDDLERINEIPELPGAAGVIITGDMTFGGGVKQAARVLEAVAAKNPNILAQIGNMDRSEVTDWLEEKGWNLHGRARELFPGVMAIGVGCSNFTPFGTPSEYPESRLAEWMEQGLNAAGRDCRLVLISHTPPHATGCDRLHDGTPVGSTSVREFIEEHQPDCCICGHIHESRAQELMGKTMLINPGTLGSGGYVLLARPDPEGPVQAELKILP